MGRLNPFRGRGYCYDEESGFYYVSSRYYDPEIGRFINADAIDSLSVEQGSLSQYNLFAYCLNSPVNMVDYGGDIPQSIIKGVLRLTARTATSMFGKKWYNAAKNIIAAAGNAFLASKKYSVARALFNNGMWGGGKTISQSTRKLIINALKKSDYFNTQVKAALKNSKSTTVKGLKVSMNFTSGDLFYGIGKIDFYLYGTKKNGKWTVSFSCRY